MEIPIDDLIELEVLPNENGVFNIKYDGEFKTIESTYFETNNNFEFKWIRIYNGEYLVEEIPERNCRCVNKFIQFSSRINLVNFNELSLKEIDIHIIGSDLNDIKDLKLNVSLNKKREGIKKGQIEKTYVRLNCDVYFNKEHRKTLYYTHNPIKSIELSFNYNKGDTITEEFREIFYDYMNNDKGNSIRVFNRTGQEVKFVYHRDFYRHILDFKEPTVLDFGYIEFLDGDKTSNALFTFEEEKKIGIDDTGKICVF